MRSLYWWLRMSSSFASAAKPTYEASTSRAAKQKIFFEVVRVQAFISEMKPYGNSSIHLDQLALQSVRAILPLTYGPHGFIIQASANRLNNAELRQIPVFPDRGLHDAVALSVRRFRDGQIGRTDLFR